MPHDVFISYAAEDKAIADAVCAKIEERRIRCWIAPRNILPGETYAEAIIDAIDASRIMVLVFSSHANASKHVMREVQRGVHNGIPIIPFRIEEVQPSSAMQYYIGPQHWLDAMTPPLESHLLKLADAINFLLKGREGESEGEITDIRADSSQAKELKVEEHVKRGGRHLIKKQHVFVLIIVVAIIAAVGAFYWVSAPKQSSNQNQSPTPTRTPVPPQFKELQLTITNVTNPSKTVPNNFTIGKQYRLSFDNGTRFRLQTDTRTLSGGSSIEDQTIFLHRQPEGNFWWLTLYTDKKEFLLWWGYTDWPDYQQYVGTYNSS